MKQYTVGTNPLTGRPIITILGGFKQLPFYVWRDLIRLSGVSYTVGPDEVYEFHSSEFLASAEKVLTGGCFVRKDS